MTALCAHQSDEVERAQVYLEELLQVVRLHRYLWTPCAIALLKVQPGEETKRERKRGRGWKWFFKKSDREIHIRIIAGKGKEQREEKLEQVGKEKVRGK